MISFIASFIAIFIAWIGFFRSVENYTNIYTFTQKIDVESYNQQEINIDVFWENFSRNGLRVNWLDFVEFRQTEQENPYIEIQSVINHRDENRADKYFENLEDFYTEKINNQFHISAKNIFSNDTSFQFLRRNIIIYIPEWKNVKLWEISPYGSLKNRIYIENDSYYYWLASCENKTISYVKEKESFTCYK